MNRSSDSEHRYSRSRDGSRSRFSQMEGEHNAGGLREHHMNVPSTSPAPLGDGGALQGFPCLLCTYALLFTLHGALHFESSHQKCHGRLAILFKLDVGKRGLASLVTPSKKVFQRHA